MKNGLPALIYAAYNGHEDAVSCLIEAGAHLEATDKVGRCCVWWCATEFEAAGGTRTIPLVAVLNFISVCRSPLRLPCLTSSSLSGA